MFVNVGDHVSVHVSERKKNPEKEREQGREHCCLHKKRFEIMQKYKNIQGYRILRLRVGL